MREASDLKTRIEIKCWICQLVLATEVGVVEKLVLSTGDLRVITVHVVHGRIPGDTKCYERYIPSHKESRY